MWKVAKVESIIEGPPKDQLSRLSWPLNFVEYGVYSASLDRAWHDAWAVTEHAFLGLESVTR